MARFRLELSLAERKIIVLALANYIRYGQELSQRVVDDDSTASAHGCLDKVLGAESVAGPSGELRRAV